MMKELKGEEISMTNAKTRRKAKTEGPVSRDISLFSNDDTCLFNEGSYFPYFLNLILPPLSVVFFKKEEEI